MLIILFLYRNLYQHKKRPSIWKACLSFLCGHTQTLQTFPQERLIMRFVCLLIIIAAQK